MRSLPLALLIGCATPGVSDTGTPAGGFPELVLTGDVTITNSLEADALYGYTVIEGSLDIEGHALEHVDSLVALREVTGNVSARWTQSLTTLAGLSALESIGGSLWVMKNHQLVELGFGPVAIEREIYIYNNSRLCQTKVGLFLDGVTHDDGLRDIEPNDPGC
jgi:hypothetical protein